jgi:hypothetical protein
MNSELEKIVDSILSNGELSDRSRELLMKKAEQLGVDLLDFELELESKIAQKKSSSNSQIKSQEPPKSNKEGVSKKCPSCGASAGSFATSCPDCGHEFRDIQAARSVQKLFEEMKESETRLRNQHSSKTFLQQGNIGAEIDQNNGMIISSFPVPNTKEDLLEFLAMAFNEANKKVAWLDKLNTDFGPAMYKKTWQAKCEQIIMKARLSMKDDKQTLEHVEYYAKQLGLK